MTTNGKLRGFFWYGELEVEVQIKDSEIIFGNDLMWSNLRMATVFSQAVAKGNDVLVLYEDQDYFFDSYSTANQAVQVENGSVLCAFAENLVEIFPDEESQFEADVLLVTVDSYPCHIEINGLIIEVSENDIDFVDREEEGDE